MSAQYRFGLCNELFEHSSLAETCTVLREIGYSGIEIAPFTLAPDATALTASERAAIRDEIRRHDLAFIGLHWLLISPPGLHATAADQETRSRTWKFLRGLVDLCADLQLPGESGALLVFGSPKQRSSSPGVSPADAVAILADGLAHLAPHAEERGVQILLEPLSPGQCDVVTSLSEAVEIVRQIASPAVATMFDVHNAVDEQTPHPELIREFLPYIRHVHVNEFDGREPGTGDYDFSSLLAELSALQYSRWVSLEVFDFSRDSRDVAHAAFAHLKQSVPSNHLTHTL